MEATVLTRDWYTQLEEASATNFVNLPVEFQLRGYSYDSISQSYLNFFRSETNSRKDKVILAKKFLRFIRNINKNRARAELGESFFKCFEYFMENFKDLTSKQDLIHLESLDIIVQGIDKSAFIEDIISVDELQRRVENLERTKEREEFIEVEFSSTLQEEYEMLNGPNN